MESYKSSKSGQSYDRLKLLKLPEADYSKKI